MQVADTVSVDERVERVRSSIAASREAQALMKRLAPQGMVSTDDTVVDFCDWQKFEQWSQTNPG